MKKLYICSATAILCFAIVILLTSQKQQKPPEDELAWRISKSVTFNAIHSLNQQMAHQSRIEYFKHKNKVQTYKRRDVKLLMNNKNITESERNDALAKAGYVKNEEFIRLSRESIPLEIKFHKEFPELNNYSFESKKAIFKKAIRIIDGN